MPPDPPPSLSTAGDTFPRGDQGRSARSLPERLGPIGLVVCIIWLVALSIIAVRLIVVHHEHHKLTSTTTAEATTAAAGSTAAKQPTTTVYELLAAAGYKWATGQNVYENTFAYRYSPLIAALLVPFSFLPTTVGGTLWLLLNAAIFFWGLLYWLGTAAPWNRLSSQSRRGGSAFQPIKEGGGRGIGFPADQEGGAWSANHRMLVLLLATPLLIGNFNNTQANPMLLGFMLVAVAACLDARFTLAALCITAATLLKVYPLALGLVLIVIYPRQLSWRIALFLLLGVTLPFALQKPHYVADAYANWYIILVNDRRGGQMQTAYRDLALLWHFYTGHEVNRQFYLGLQLAAAGFIGLVAVFLRRWTALPRERLLLLLSLVVVWIMLLGPSTESATYMLLAPPVVLLLFASWVPPVGRKPAAGVRILFLLAYLILLSVVIVQITPRGRDYATLRAQPFAALIFLGGVLAWAIHIASVRRSRSREPGPT